MIFNSTTKGPGGVNLDSGTISRSILLAAGQVILAEVLQQCPRPLQAGEHVTSSGGKLGCQLIFHAVLCPWDQGTGQSKQVYIITSFIHVASRGPPGESGGPNGYLCGP